MPSPAKRSKVLALVESLAVEGAPLMSDAGLRMVCGSGASTQLNGLVESGRITLHFWSDGSRAARIIYGKNAGARTAGNWGEKETLIKEQSENIRRDAKPWPRFDELLIELWIAQETNAVICQKINEAAGKTICTKNAVHGRIERMRRLYPGRFPQRTPGNPNLKSPWRTPEQIAKIKRRIAEREALKKLDEEISARRAERLEGLDIRFKSCQFVKASEDEKPWIDDSVKCGQEVVLGAYCETHAHLSFRGDIPDAIRRKMEGKPKKYHSVWR